MADHDSLPKHHPLQRGGFAALRNRLEARLLHWLLNRLRVANAGFLLLPVQPLAAAPNNAVNVLTSVSPLVDPR